jgi:hypothetical protein
MYRQEDQLGAVFQVGKSHLKKKILCQDRAVAVEKDGLKIIILSDGMGSYKHADLGALFVIDYILEKANDIYKLLDTQDFNDDKEPIWTESGEGKIFAKSLFSLLRQMEAEAKKYVKRIGTDIEQLHCTLSFVIVGDCKVIAAAIGDSPIWIKRQSKEGIDVIDGNDGADNGTFSAMNLKLALDYMAVAVFPASDLEAVLMMSDGCFGYDKEKIYEPFDVKRYPFPEWFYYFIAGKRSIHKTVDQLVKKGFDDCSFAYYWHRPMGVPYLGTPDHVKTTKDNFFGRYKFLQRPKVFTYEGKEITSEPVLALVNEVKQFAEKNDFDGFVKIFIKDHSKSDHLRDNDEARLFLNSVIAEYGVTVFDLVVDADDMLY